ncbi:SusC/RagA family TonB-linked outer membrane protein [Membranihabitans marinus]|uniref:SusC/RagA family TonB-linked outer membrane protein n=1 Tax=Membranihabitans marinus TaxID=1227546 RepID=UPI001F023A4A|nr:SusC/RagA family TonB-linked outer membrane protein [Membranihabitans marinus]
MKKQKLLFVLFTVMVSCMTAFAQEMKIEGTVTDEDGLPLIAANILLVETDQGVVTDFNGKYIITAESGQTLRFSYVGYASQDIVVGSSNTIDVVLSEGNQLDEIVVTALGISRERKALGYAVEDLNSEEISKTNQVNLVNSLQGRIAGLYVNNSSGAPGAGADILIRGISSLNPSRSNRPLFVIDGIEVSDDIDAPPIIPGGADYGIGSNSRTQGSSTNRIADINPDDIESMSVLKGAAATALYGVRAANGVIIIKTKQGSSAKPQISAHYTHGWSEVNKVPEVQTSFIDGNRSTSLKRTFEWDSWGAGVTDQTTTKVSNVYEDFYQTGQSSNVGLSLAAGSDNFKYRVSGNYSSDQGIIPTSYYDKATINLSSTYQGSDKFKINTNIIYTNAKGNTPHEGRKSIMNVLAYMSNISDATFYETPYTYGNNFAAGIIDHPLFLAENISNESLVNRIIGGTQMSYQLLPSVSLNYSLGLDHYGDARERIVHPETDEGQSGVLGSPYGFLVDNNISKTSLTSNLYLAGNFSLNQDFSLSATLGHYTYGYNAKRVTLVGKQFELDNFFNLNNTIDLEQSNSDTKYRNMAVFADLTLDYKRFLYLTVTGRNDWSSTLPVDNRSYFFPSTNLSWVVSDMTDLPDIISFLKLRGSYAMVGKDADPYEVGKYFQLASGFPFGDVIGYTQQSSFGDENLKPEFTKTTEFGLDLRLMNNRLGFDLSYYQSKLENMILSVPISNATGASRFLTNAGDLDSKGFEALVTGTIFESKDGLNWDISLNYSKTEGKVKSINTGSEDNEIILATNRNVTNKYVVGGLIGDLYGQPFERTEDGRLIVMEDGLPRLNSDTSVLMGNALPDFILGMTNSISYKNLALSFLWEWKKGGKVIDVSRPYSIDNGQLTETNGRYERVVFDAVQLTGTDGSGNPIYEENTTAVEIDPAGFYRNSNIYRYAPEAHLHDASWIRLRNVNLTYTLPSTLFGNNQIEKAQISLVGNNLFLNTPYRGYDPELNYYGSGSNIYGFTGMRTPATKSYYVKFNIVF